MDTLEKDLRFLSDELPDRQAQTDEEKRAAQYVCERLGASVENARRVDFPGLGNQRLLFPAYCGEFVFVCLVSYWWPTVAFFYGLAIFLAYMAEFIGYPVFSRFLPHYESSGAVGLVKSGDASCFLVFTAYLDTDDNPFARLEAGLAKYYLHYAVILAMVCVVAICGIDALGVIYSQVNPHTWWMRWAGLGVFCFFALAGLVRAMGSRENKGANNNASGVAALLHIADKQREHPFEDATVLFYAAGSHHANMAGMRTMLTENLGVAENAFIINIEAVGDGHLHYTRAEGILHQMPCDLDLIESAGKLAGKCQAAPVAIHNRRTNAYLPLMRGARAISVMRLDDDGLPAYYGGAKDTREFVKMDAVRQAALFAEEIGRDIVWRHFLLQDVEE